MRERIKKIGDDIISNILAAGLIALATLLMPYIKSLLDNKTFKEAFISFWTQKIDIRLAVLALVIFFLLRFVFIKLLRFRYDSATLAMDKKLFDKIQFKYLTQEMIADPRSHTFSSNPFDGELLFALFKILNEGEKSDFIFMNPSLEKKKKAIIAAVRELQEITGEYLFGVRSNVDLLAIPSEWEHDDPEKFEHVAKEIYQRERMLTEKYDTFIKAGRQILKF